MVVESEDKAIRAIMAAEEKLGGPVELAAIMPVDPPALLKDVSTQLRAEIKAGATCSVDCLGRCAVFRARSEP